MKKTWSNRFDQEMSKELKTYTSSIKEDKFLAKYDIKCTIAHSKSLKYIKVINNKEYKNIKLVLKNILKNLKNIKWKSEYEDIHLNIENILIKKLGKTGEKIRTARSRNDLVNTDLKLWVRDKIEKLLENIIIFLKKLTTLAKKEYKTIFPGFTHFQLAQPTTFGHYLLCYYEMFKRDIKKLLFFKNINNICPLGSCAMVGTSFKIDRKKLSSLLGFKAPCKNSIDGVSERDYVVDFLYIMSLIMIHFSRFSEDIINYTNTCVDIIELSDCICTGSSIMPQKKNPDILELARGKSSVVLGKFFSFMSIINSQTLAYNKDNQEDKNVLRTSYKIVYRTILVFTKVIENIKVKEKRCFEILEKSFCMSTDIADFLTKNGIPFKRSHSIVSSLVRKFLNFQEKFKNINNKEIKKISLKYYKLFKKKKVILKYISVLKSVFSKKNIGNTSPKLVKKEAIKSLKYLKKIELK